jgi:hypothetical protein
MGHDFRVGMVNASPKNQQGQSPFEHASMGCGIDLASEVISRDICF